MTIKIKSFSLLTEPLAFTFALDDPEDFAGFLLVGLLFNLLTTNLVSFFIHYSRFTEKIVTSFSGTFQTVVRRNDSNCIVADV